ncbi:MAG: tetratricopeptide repeat protein, partial [Planctomycetes bacterium]|nr:tetratricopeptide repeat protein [Planctomycetota bacterium]
HLATSVEAPFWEARSLLAQALHAARRRGEARALLLRIAPEAVHPAGSLSTAAEWAWRDRDHPEALRLFAEAIAASPPHRRGRLRCRRAELLLETGDPAAARSELDTACREDPAYPRARELLLAAGGKPPILPPH